MLAPRLGLTMSSKLALALIVLLSTTISEIFAASNDGDAFYTFMRPRVGHFSRYEHSNPYAHIYETYFAHVIKNNNRAMLSISVDDWRKLRPTGELCVEFLTGLTVKSYLMPRPYDVIIMDACLDWIYNENEAEQKEKMEDVARLGSSRRSALALLEQDAKLRHIYESTRFKDPNGVPDELQSEIYGYLVRLLEVYSENPKSGCHGKWLETYNDFVDKIYVRNCKDETSCVFYGLEGSDQDTYLRMIAESTKEATKTCYKVMQGQIRHLMETEFEHTNSRPISLKKRVFKTAVSRQLESEKWAREMVMILQLASGTNHDTPVNLGDVVRSLDKIKSRDEESVQQFTDALSDYAVENADLKDSRDESSERSRFGQAMGKLCRPYTDMKTFLSKTGGINTDADDSERKPFEFYTLIYSLVRVTNHEDIFGVTKDQFEDDVIKNRWEALYLATYACQVISTTWGELSYDTIKPKFNILFRPQATIMIADWPLDVLNEKLPLIYPKSRDTFSSAASKSNKLHKEVVPSPMFGKKFKLNFRAKSKDSEEQQQQQAARPAPPAPLTGLAAILENPAGPPTHVVQQHKLSGTPTGKSGPAPVLPLIQKAREMARDPPIMSLDTILMYKKLHGRYPNLPDHYKKIYPELPDDLSGEYPKELGQPATPKPIAPSSAFVKPQTKTTGKADISALKNLKF